jgi:hypothetical protein
MTTREKILLFFLATGVGFPNSSGGTLPLSFTHWRWGGSVGLTYRNIAHKPIEIEVEHQLTFSDAFFRVEGPVLADTPFLMEFSLDGDGRPRLYRLAIKTLTIRRVELEFGRFLVPFGRTNEQYRPDLYPLATKPLLYASPGLDFASRINHPHPFFSAGYTDTGVQATYLPHGESVGFPQRITAFLVNGLAESPLQGRPPPEARIPETPISAFGTDIDWGHERNSLGDNNDTKSVGCRFAWDYGDMSRPGPFSRAAVVNGFSVVLSGLGGRHDLEDRLSHWMGGMDLGLRHRNYRLTAEVLTSKVEASWPRLGTLGSAGSPNLLADYYTQKGHTLEMEFPLPKAFPFEAPLFILRGESMSRRGPELNEKGEVFPNTRIKRRTNKYSSGFSGYLTPYFIGKVEYSSWSFDQHAGIWQILWSGVLTF